MGKIVRVPHAIDVADRFIDGVRVLIDDWGDDTKWQSPPTEPSVELGGYVSRVSQIVQLSHYAVELMLKVLYQQDYGEPFKSGRGHLNTSILKELKVGTRELVEVAFAERVNTGLHGDLFKYPHSDGNAESVIVACDGKYNLYRYEIFEKDDMSGMDLSYDFAVVDVLRALVVCAKGREPTIMEQYNML